MIFMIIYFIFFWRAPFGTCKANVAADVSGDSVEVGEVQHRGRLVHQTMSRPPGLRKQSENLKMWHLALKLALADLK